MVRKSISNAPIISRVAVNAARTRSRSSGWMRDESASNVTTPSPGATPHMRWARSSMAMSSVSTFHAHRATPAASVAMRRWSASHIGGVVLSRDIGSSRGGPDLAWFTAALRSPGRVPSRSNGPCTIQDILNRLGFSVANSDAQCSPKATLHAYSFILDNRP